MIIGVDVSARSLTVAWDQTVREVANARAGWEQLATWVGTTDIHLIVEPTGGYETALLDWADARGWTISLVNPGQVRQWAKGSGFRQKTDRSDARMLHRYGSEKHLPRWVPPPPEQRTLQAMVSYTEGLEKMLQAERNRLQQGHPLPDSVRQTLEQHIAQLQNHVQTLHTLSEQLITRDPELTMARDRLMTVPGCGAKVALVLLLHFLLWSQVTDGPLTDGQIAATAGLDPVAYRSGTSVYHPPHISRQGNATVRSRLYLAALGGQRGKQPRHLPLQQFMNRLAARGKKRKVILIAAGRKILIWAWHVYQARVPFEPALVVRTPLAS